MSDHASSESNKKPEAQGADITNVLQHIKSLEDAKVELENRLRQSEQRAERMSVKTRESMQAAMDTLMKKWMDAVDTKDEAVKMQFKTGLDKLINNSAEENGVWQMMVAASSLHERQEHNLEKLRIENNELRTKVDTLYGSTESRVVGEKHRQKEQLDRADVQPDAKTDIWGDFAAGLQSF
jgi:uncharacterized membrane protein YheB (UPF0754 family)